MRPFGAIARIYGWDTVEPRDASTSGAALYPAQAASRPMLALCDTVDVPDRQNAKPTNHALAPLRSPRGEGMTTRHVGHIDRFVEAAVWRLGAIARTYTRRMDRRSPPSRQNTRGGPISAADSGATPGACVSMTRWTRPKHRIVRTRAPPVTREPRRRPDRQNGNFAR